MSESAADSPFAALGNISDTGEVQGQVSEILREFAPGHDPGRIHDAFALLDRAFAGKLPGYQRLLTPYHNRMHTNEVVLCTTRMLHGMHLAGHGVEGDYLDAAVIGALMHDVGYLMSDDEAAGTGAQFTDTHVQRGVDFIRQHLAGLSPGLLEATEKVILLTDHRQSANRIDFQSSQLQRAAYATSSADLLGQMANRQYLERLLLLYLEFEEAQMGDFANLHELLEKTTGFYRITQTRLDQELDGVSNHLTRHFAASSGIARNQYADAIARNLGYLNQVVGEDRPRRLRLLKRGGVVEQVLALGHGQDEGEGEGHGDSPADPAPDPS